MKIDAVRFEQNHLILDMPPQTAVFRFIREFKAGEYEITRTKKKRSRNANDYFWVLVTKIAERVMLRKEDVYRQLVKDYGCCKKIAVPESDVEIISEGWSNNGTAWFTERVDVWNNLVYLNAYYGSSFYDTAQMSRLIEGTIQEAQQLGIEIMPDEELQSLLASWEGRR